MFLLFAIQSSGPLAKPFLNPKVLQVFCIAMRPSSSKTIPTITHNLDVRFKSATFTVAYVLTKLSLT